MPFAHEQTVAEDVRDFYGQYHSTFRSENGQVIAHLFERDGWLVHTLRLHQASTRPMRPIPIGAS